MASPVVVRSVPSGVVSLVVADDLEAPRRARGADVAEPMAAAVAALPAPAGTVGGPVGAERALGTGGTGFDGARRAFAGSPIADRCWRGVNGTLRNRRQLRRSRPTDRTVRAVSAPRSTRCPGRRRRVGSAVLGRPVRPRG